jgi:asparagine synthase (glutamine-hydrolysing)
MIGLYLRHSGAPLEPPQAERFEASLGIGAGLMGKRQLGGALLAAPVKDKGRARSWSPPRGPDGTFALLLGHIDNRATLIHGLAGKVDPSCDNAALYAYCHADWGDDCDNRIIGEYAAILWSPDDAKVRFTRSPIRAPALHYWHDAERLIVASTARAICATGEVERKVDEQKIADSLYLNYCEAERGWFAGVKRLPIGSRGLAQAGRMSTSRFYDAGSLPRVRYAKDADYVEAANALFDEATRAALQGFSRPAVSLSGGYDSQAVASTACKIMGPNARVLGLTSVPEASWDGRTPAHRFGDESAHVAALAALYPALETRKVAAAGLSFDHKLESLFLMAGAPPRNTMNLHWLLEIGSHAKAAGCDVLLTGAMGNATFSFDGHGALPGMLKSGQWRALLREARAAAKIRKSSTPRALVAGAVMPLLPMRLFELIMRWRHGKKFSRLPDWCALNPDWAESMGVARRAVELGFDPGFGAKSSCTAIRIAMMGGAANEGGDLSTAINMLSGIETRDPTSYRPLFEFCMGIPDNQFLRDGEARWLAKRMFRGVLPDLVIDETRRGLQGADWHLRLARQRGDIMQEIGHLSEDSAMAQRLDLPRMKAALANWPTETPVSDEASANILHYGLPRALVTARYIRFVEGRND